MCIDKGDNASKSIRANTHKTLFAANDLLILYQQGQGIAESALGVGKAHPVLALIELGLDLIP